MASPEYMKKNKGGRPLLFKNKEELEQKIDEYFDKCDKRMVERVNKRGEVIIINHPEPYTMSGLAYSIGVDRQTILNYAKKEEFFGTIKKARDKVEADVEKRMNDRDAFTPGLIFNAKNNFNWKDKQEVDHTTGGDKFEGLVIVKNGNSSK